MRDLVRKEFPSHQKTLHGCIQKVVVDGLIGVCTRLTIRTLAYFDESLEATYYTIDRLEFEARLEKHFNDPSHNNGPAWYALRNVVFASGCRILTFKFHSWTEAQTRSRGYFENALAVEADLLHGTAGVIAVQALLAMVSPIQNFLGNRSNDIAGSLRRRCWQCETGIHACQLRSPAGTCTGSASSTNFIKDIV